MGRKKLDISEETVAAMAFAGSPTVEIAEFHGCDEGTIRKRFSEILTKGRASRRIKLRQAQWKVAIGGNVTMLIFLGKQELGQKDAVELTSFDLAGMNEEQLRAVRDGRIPPGLKLERT